VAKTQIIFHKKLQIIFHKRATKHTSLLWKMTYKDKGSYESSLPCIECHSWSNCALSHNTVHTNQYTSTTQLLSTTLRVIELFSFPHHRDIELHFISRSNGTIPEYQHMILLKDIFRAVCGFFIDFFEHKCWFTAGVTFG